MNISTWSRNKKLLVLALAIFFFVGIGVTVYLVQKQQELRSHAQKATVLTLSPSNQSAPAGSDANVDVSLNPGTNQVNFVKLTLKFDPNTFDGNLVVFNVDPNSPLQVVGNIQPLHDDEVTVTLSVGSDPTKVVQSTTTLGTFKLPLFPDAQPGQTTVTIDKSNTQVRSISSNDSFNENVLNSTVDATVTVTGGQCIPNQSTCSWDASDGATSYHYKIIETAPDSDVHVPLVEDDTSNTSVKFTSKPGYTYSCFVTANSQCGSSSETNGSSTCPISPTPTITVTPTITPTPTVTPTPKLTVTPTTALTSTPTPTTPALATPTTPEQAFITASPTNVVIAQAPTITPAPTLPATGNPVVMGGIVGGILFVLGGLALLFL